MARGGSVDDGSKVIVDLSDPVEPAVVKLPTAPIRHTGSWVVVVAYVIAATALALAVYERFVA